MEAICILKVIKNILFEMFYLKLKIIIYFNFKQDIKPDKVLYLTEIGDMRTREDYWPAAQRVLQKIFYHKNFDQF
jgi:hypothetical protein